LRVKEEAALDVVLGAPGYPEAVESGGHISGVADAADMKGVEVFHAGTTSTSTGLTTSGGRVLNVVGLGDDVPAAREAAYAAAARIDFEGMQYRTDIGRSQ
jgi:phosphoribosylamine--glycine ligase